ncbi:MAG TPA: TolC family protein [Vicinamibacterales bacterium]|nr:TolC family protein [Vicinamibacterales bacterium]
MRSRSRLMLFTLTMLAAVATQALGQTTLSLTLEEAIRRGLAHAPRLAEVRAREAAADSTISARNAVRLPSLTATGEYFRSNHVDEFGIVQPNGAFRVVFPDIPNNYRVRADLMVPLYPVRAAEAFVESARADRRAVAAEGRAQAGDVQLEVSRAFWTLVTARESVGVIEQALRRTDAWVGDVKTRVETGMLPPNDLLSAQAQRARHAVQLIQARNAALFAEADLARLIGLDDGQSIVPATAVEQPTPGAVELAAQPVGALSARAREQRGDRTALLERQQALTASAASVVGASEPRIAARVGVEPARPNQRFAPRSDEWKTSWDVGVQVSWLLWDSGKARADRAVALAQADAVGHQVEAQDALIVLEIRQRLWDLEAGRAAVAASAEAVAAATEARRVIQERFNAGVATSTELLDADVALLEAELERTRLAASLRVNEARLIRSVGGTP